jgi:formate dehydrogenase subunit gamma
MRKTTTEPEKILRFTLGERVTHWMVALGFVYAALTGLSLWSPRLYWLAAVFGGGATTARWHPWGGLLFAAAFLVMFRRWRAPMRLDQDDRLWLRRSRSFIVHDESRLVESGRFNGGQKVLFWLQASSGLLLLSSGLVLWWPALLPRTLRLAAVLLHPAAAVISIGGIIVHIYMGTLAIPGALRGMVQGWVTPAWAALHHAKWRREMIGR